MNAIERLNRETPRISASTWLDLQFRLHRIESRGTLAMTKLHFEGDQIVCELRYFGDGPPVATDSDFEKLLQSLRSSQQFYAHWISRALSDVGIHMSPDDLLPHLRVDLVVDKGQSSVCGICELHPDGRVVDRRFPPRPWPMPEEPR